MKHYFMFKNSRFNINIEFYDKLNFIFGFSGDGKSLLVQHIEIEDRTGTELKSDLSIVVLSTKNSYADFDSDKVLVIVDEIPFKWFFDKVTDSKCYWLIISRKNYSNLKTSYRSFWKVSNIDEVLSIVPRVNVDIINEINFSPKCKIYTEDSGYGLKFLSLLCNAESSYGISNMDKVIKHLEKDNTSIIIIDGGGVGYNLNSIMKAINNMKRAGCSILLFMPECFEHVLLCSETLNFDEDLSRYYSTKYQNTEEFCEEKLLDITKGTKIECNHSTNEISDCWLKDCKGDCIKDCDYFITGDKIISVLKNGPLKDLIPLYKKNTSLNKLTERYDKCRR